MTIAANPSQLGPDARVRDLRDHPARRLTFPARGVVLLAGIPGAGKTTLLRRLYGLSGQERAPVRTAGGVLILDSEQARNRWAASLRRLPYKWWRPLVHLTHYAWLWLALGRPAPIVLHECGTRGWLFAALVRRAARHGREVHVVLLDVPASVALAAQRDRGRQVHPVRFGTHARRWRRLVTNAERAEASTMPGAVSVTLLDRASAAHLRSLEFAR
jgi:energy-coupling factor transporter ATP-binding protein EcfA2